MASRLPRPQSSPEPKAGFAPSLKRKVVPEEDDIDALQPTKRPASSATGGFRPRPLQTSRNATNSTSSSTSTTRKPSAAIPPPLTRPRAPIAARTTTSAAARGTNLPTARKPPTSRVPSTSAKRVVSAPEPTVAAPDVITNLHKRITTLEEARTQDSERVATTSISVTAPSAAQQEQLQTLQSDLITAQVQLASTSAQLQSTSNQLSAAQAQNAALQGELGAAKGLLRARDDAEQSFKKDILALKAEVLEGKSALARSQDECSDVRRSLAREQEEADIRLRRGERLLREAKDEIDDKDARITKLRAELAGAVDAGAQTMEQHRTSTLRIALLESQLAEMHRAQKEWEQEKAELEEEKRAMKEEVTQGEEERRRLHEMVMELKGNIRVFCRVRPILPSESDATGDGESPAAQIAYPDATRPYPSGEKEIVMSAAGPEREWDAGMGNKPRKEVWSFNFDRVFTPASTQADLFAEISQLAQSCTDGYNVCIFAYGQTGSGKSWTMEGGNTEETEGMIPRAVAQVFRVADELKDKGWTYTMEGQFLEIYNETITDLLSPNPAPGDPPRKHEIHHHPTTHLTTVSDSITPVVTSPAHVQSLLSQAQKRRRVAATIMNERSSRSHSVFTLRIRGVQQQPGAEPIERVGTLNLVDLAGSERLAALNHHAGALGQSIGGSAVQERLKETQNINRSLSALGDVIAALGNGPGAHVPYRNSKLTYLLQNSLSGNSKTLMVLNLSPLSAHLNESLTSLRFATKVNNTTIGTAKKVQVSNGSTGRS
ncbi:Kinesin-like protein [Mycena indigotica]|uniref:Kinesin-like protein n=1 Tax=Mycena indigotica TaxID=2126181 RepID=A0A8H6SZU8_9AGAR|nr:Kinesin-like protein [Mycena indigotica]KAF7309350.1 Kinesin-like protein [Mycena indigotica]